jgi:hypothetical protein
MCGWPENEFTAAVTDAAIGSHKLTRCGIVFSCGRHRGAAKLEYEVRQQIQIAAIALENAHQAYAAAVESSNYQQQLLYADFNRCPDRSLY